ncbi:hypothetical protein CEUSTIGMA_g8410.t1 [Chlamydomonas eustigma]|uniref:FAS1 domain-containing protein n=1 Tax=Chlamydomonas eustigma TaxID=1157962 RepID=A0A250XD26_9CHLO|nr:hypothetical protein CEUSTIGMA_g8410.t1 [Chlamydomonas eustigma]|eukprot:GAX80975.1 hypothetical protein CEUSTIGMA_g8410.t1 [Chlamydomonas eustigma]
MAACIHHTMLCVMSIYAAFLIRTGSCSTPKDVFVEASAVETSAETIDLATVVCLQPDLGYFCTLITVAKSDPVVASLFDPNTVATVFAPTTRGINNTRYITLRLLGTTLTGLAQDPVKAAMFVRANIISEKVLFSNLRNGQVYYNYLSPQQSLTVLEGTGRQVPPGTVRSFFLKTSTTTVRIGFQDRYNLIGGAGFVTVSEDPIIPPTSSS